ncbi:MAG: hypothetical protein MJZ41_17115 [Bacteroidaceae bacterium]|nr:hypothetical protein [Bacteroidaceae bacterium]
MKTKVYYFLLIALVSFALSSCCEYDDDDITPSVEAKEVLPMKNYQFYPPGGSLIARSLDYNNLKLERVVVKEDGMDYSKGYDDITSFDKYSGYISSEDWGKAYTLSEWPGEVFVDIDSYEGKSRVILVCVSAEDGNKEWIKINQDDFDWDSHSSSSVKQ